MICCWETWKENCHFVVAFWDLSRNIKSHFINICGSLSPLGNWRFEVTNSHISSCTSKIGDLNWAPRLIILNNKVQTESLSVLINLSLDEIIVSISRDRSVVSNGASSYSKIKPPSWSKEINRSTISMIRRIIWFQSL